MAFNSSDVQKRAQALSDSASAQAAASASPAEENAPVSSSVASGDTTGTSVKTSTVSEATKTVSPYSNESDSVKLIVVQLETYVLKAAPGLRQTPASLKELQGNLIATLDQLVNLKENVDFALCMRRLLTLVKENDSKAFAANMRNRAISAQTKSDVYLTRYLRFLDMICAFAVPAVRASLIQRYNVAAGAEFAKPEYRERLIEFIRAISGR